VFIAEGGLVRWVGGLKRGDKKWEEEEERRNRPFGGVGELAAN